MSTDVKVNYQKVNPYKFLYNTRDPVELLKYATNTAVRQAVSDMKVNEVISQSRTTLQRQLREHLTAIMQRYHTGIKILSVIVQKTTVPDNVKTAYNAVVNARAELQSYKNLAQKYSQKKENTVKGVEACLTNRAKAYSALVKQKARGDVARYNSLLEAYKSDPQATKDRLYLETMQQVLSHTTNVVMSNGANNMVYLPLDQIAKQLHRSDTVHSGNAANSQIQDQESADISSVSLAYADSATEDLNYCLRTVGDDLEDLSSSFDDQDQVANETNSNSAPRPISTPINNSRGGVRYGS